MAIVANWSDSKRSLRHYRGFADEAAFPQIERPNLAQNSRSIVSAQEHESESPSFAGCKGRIQQWPSIVEKRVARFRACARTSPSRQDSGPAARG
jgi:hypothetical protein